MTKAEMTTVVAEVIAGELGDLETRLRAVLFEKLLAARSPEFRLTPRGELFIDGQLAGDVRPIFREVVDAAVREHVAPLLAARTETGS